MFIAILGLIIMIAGIVMRRSAEPVNRYGGIVRSIGIVIVLLGFMFSAVKVIQPGKVGVQTLFGQVQNEVLNSGLHVINPLVDVTLFSIQTENYTMSAKSGEGQVEGDDAIRVLSSDGLEVTIDLSVLYTINPAKAPFILQHIGEDYQDK